MKRWGIQKIFDGCRLGVFISTLGILLMTGLKSQTQQLHYSVGVECLSSGNGLGGFSSPYIGFNNNYNQWSLGALIQNRSSEFRGLRMGYVRNLSGYIPKSERDYERDEHRDFIDISSIVCFQYFQNALMSKKEIRYSELINRRKDHIDFNTLRLNTIEGLFGIELRVNINGCIVWRNYVGVGFYYHLNYIKGIYMDRLGNSLLCGTGIQIDIMNKRSRSHIKEDLLNI